jgi:hypothetical protein
MDSTEPAEKWLSSLAHPEITTKVSKDLLPETAALRTNTAPTR